MPTVIPVELPTSPVGGAPRTPWEAPTGAATPTSRSQAEALFQQDVEDAAVPYSERVSAALADTDTAYIAEGVLGIFDQVEPEDPDFDPLPHIQAVREAYSLPSDDDTLAELGSARSMAELSRAGEAIRGRLDRAKLLDGHWGLALTAGVLDPVGLVADSATFYGARVYKLGRLASAVAGAGSVTAVTAAADASGREATLLDYTLGAAVNAGVFALVGGKGVGAPAFDRLGKPSFGGGLNDFLSETDKIAGANPLTRELNSRLVDDPVRRDGLLRNENAASYLRIYSNQADHLLYGWEQTLDKEIARAGVGYMSRKFDLTGKAAQARADIEDAVAAELLRRDSEYIRFGAVSPASDARIGALADQYEAMMRHGAETAKAARLPGFKDFEGRPGYFHRAWNENKMYEVEQAHGREFLRNMLVASARSGMGLDETDAGTIATAIITRMDAKRRGLRADFMGALGKADSEGIAAILIDAGVDDAVRKSIMRKIDQNLSDRGKIKYGKERLPLDMTISARAADGRVVRMQDLIDTDLTRLAENYMQSMSGRSALARVGLGGDDASLSEYKELQRLALEGDEAKFRVKWDEFQANVRRRFEGEPEQATAPRQTPTPTPEDFYKEYKGTGGAVQEATSQRLAPDDIDARMKQLDYLLGDFTGIRPPEGVLGTNAQRVKSLAQATMLSASGLWQVAETATMAWRYGAARAGAEMFKQFPGVAGLLRKVGRDPGLYDELATVLHVDFARDVRIRPWLRQYEANYLLKGDSGLDRALHYGQQAVPIINAMKFVHKWQTRVNANLAMNTLARAAHGDASALRMLQEYGLKGADWEQVQAAIKANVTMRGKNAESMNWAAWDKATLDKAMLAATRMMDDAVLYGRAGQGSSFSRSAVGQILGQFRSFVSFAHNKLLRGTIQNSGYTGLAALLAHQYPLTVLMVAANEFRKGGDVSFDEDGILDLMQKAVGYTAALGFIGDAAGIAGLSGGRGGYSVPITGLANAVPAAVGIPGELLAGDPTAAAGNAVQVARTALPFVSIVPGIAALQNALED